MGTNSDSKYKDRCTNNGGPNVVKATDTNVYETGARASEFN